MRRRSAERVARRETCSASFMSIQSATPASRPCAESWSGSESGWASKGGAIWERRESSRADEGRESSRVDEGGSRRALMRAAPPCAAGARTASAAAALRETVGHHRQTMQLHARGNDGIDLAPCSMQVPRAVIVQAGQVDRFSAESSADRGSGRGDVFGRQSVESGVETVVEKLLQVPRVGG